MRSTDGAARPRANFWVAIGGALVLAALAFGLLQSGAHAAPPATAAGYSNPGPGPGTGNGAPPCTQPGAGGYSQPCAAEVSGVKIKPKKPIAGKGFKVSFSSKSGGSYSVFALRKGKSTLLERGATGTGRTSTLKVGKKLKAGKYTIRVGLVSGSSTSAKTKLTIAKKK